MEGRNKNLRTAKRIKNDEFYTQESDIEMEILQHPDYVRQFRGKSVLCDCDDPASSGFVAFFLRQFHALGIHCLTATCKAPDGRPAFAATWHRQEDGTLRMETIPLPGDGGFDSPACIGILKEADIVCTNPPFSLWRSYVELLYTYRKQFVIIGSLNAATYTDTFRLLRDGQISIGYTHPKQFRQPDGTLKSFGNIVWFTNFDLDKRHRPLPLTRQYDGHEGLYPMYCNFDAIDCARVKDIPMDYAEGFLLPGGIPDMWPPEQYTVAAPDLSSVRPLPDRLCVLHRTTGDFVLSCGRAKEDVAARLLSMGVPENGMRYRSGYMGVPVSYIKKACPSQFEIIARDRHGCADAVPIRPIGKAWCDLYFSQGNTGHMTPSMRNLVLIVDGKARQPYGRVIIRRIVGENRRFIRDSFIVCDAACSDL